MPTGSRIRANNAYGITTDNPLTSGATSFNSTQLVLLPSVSFGFHSVVVLDPKRVNGQPEIIIVTNHTGLSTSATITRAAYGTISRSHPVGTAWAHVTVNEDYTEILTSITRPVDPYNGQLIYETDTKSHRYYTGVGWQSAPPIGSLLPYLGSTAPLGYLLANGASISRTTYADLFAVIATIYGSGDGVTTFNIPDLRSRVPVGRDTGAAEFDVLGETGGVKTVTLTQLEMPQHAHGVTDSTHSHGQAAHNHLQDAHGHSADDSDAGIHDHTSPDGNQFPFSTGAVDNWRIPASGSTSNGVYITFTSIDDAGSHNHNITVISATATNQATSASISAAGTGITINNAGSSGAHQNLQPYITVNYIVKY